MEVHLFSNWARLIIEDDLFEGEDDEDNWVIDETNVVELIEALNFHHFDWVREEDILSMLKDGSSDGANNDGTENKIIEPSSKPWSKLKYQLYDLLVEDKQVRFKDLIH